MSRFDGSSFAHYYSEVGDSSSLMNKSANNLHVDEKGRLWVSMRQGGLARYLPETDNFKNYARARTDTGEVFLTSTYYFATDRDGDFIIRTVDFSTFRYNEAEDIFEYYYPWNHLVDEESSDVYPVYFDTESRLWLSIIEDGQRCLKSFGGIDKNISSYKCSVPYFVNCAVEAPAGILWIGTWGGGLYRYAIKADSLTQYFPAPNPKSLQGRVIEDLELDREGNLWIATEEGLAVVDSTHLVQGAKNLTFTHPKSSTTGTAILGNFKEIECDNGGRLWFTSYGNGLYLYDPQSVSYSVLNLQDPESNKLMTVRSVFDIESSEGLQWYRMHDTILSYNPKTEDFRLIEPEGKEQSETSVAQLLNLSWAADGRIMASYQGGPLVLLDPQTENQKYYPFERNHDFPSGVLKTYRDSRGTLWVSTYHGILRHPGSDLTEFDTIVDGYDGRDIIEDQNGMIWVGSWNQGVVRIDPKTLEIKRFDPTQSDDTGLLGSDANNLVQTMDGRLWTLTSKGLNVYDEQKDRFQFIDPSADNELQLTDYFTPDSQGNVWFSSLKGLFHWRRKNKKVLFLDEDYGLPQTEFYKIRSALDGDIYVSTGVGCIHFDPKNIPNPATPGEVLFTSLQVESENGEWSQSLLELGEFQISYRENFVKIDFAPLHFNLDGKIKYEYMLDGGSGVWVDIEEATEVSFLDIPHGDYDLMVRGRNDWDEYGPVSSISFEVTPPWWLSKIAIVGYVLLLLLVVVLYNRLRTVQLRRRQKKLELIVEARTEEITLERDRSESLLLNILPAEIAEELKHKGQARAKKINHVTVLFTDFKGFTQYSEKVSPESLVEDLHESFTAFDEIMSKHGIEKIKTIGDAYMAAGGLPTPNETHARDVLAAAFEIRDFIEAGKAKKIKNNLPYFEIRIGIHTGPVVAGIVGVKKFSYDIWGDTVNTASRMESSGHEGQVNISQKTYDLVKDMSSYSFKSRGKIAAKGKGEMEMFFVEKLK
ncbi:MAG: adenylate/guanylate cyclase domain-containing protein [Cryomorphaceae bacterium]